jgi:hypothetical protein
MWAQGGSKGMAESVVAVVIAKSVVVVGIAKSVVVESVVAVVMMVTRTPNSKGLDLKPALDMTMQTRIQESKY